MLIITLVNYDFDLDSLFLVMFFQVAEALFEITLPRFSGDILPKSDVGIVLAVADRSNYAQTSSKFPFFTILVIYCFKVLYFYVVCRLDSLVGLFAVGCQPSSTSDPFGLRRISYGLVSYFKIFKGDHNCS